MTLPAHLGAPGPTVGELLAAQNGVVSRRQVAAAGGLPHDIERRLRRRDWVRLLPGIYLDHTGEPTWRQRAWAGVLYYWPAALGAESAVRAVQGPGWRDPRPGREGAPVVIAVSAQRNVAAQPGYRVRWTSHFDEVVLSTASPPRVRLEHAVLHVASRAPGEWDALEILADACRSRCTTAQRLLEALEREVRLPRRRWLGDVLADLADGTCSVLEHGFLIRVERAHGLPRSVRQQHTDTGLGSVYHDVAYPAYDTYVELDGVLFHSSATQHGLDLERDLDAAVRGRVTLRLGWRQVFGRECRTAERLGGVLRERGWAGRPRPCGPRCVL